MTTKSMKLWKVLSIAVVAIGVSVLASQWVFLWRLYTFGDHDSLTIGVDWYQPKEKVAGRPNDLPWAKDSEFVISDEVIEQVLNYAEAQNSSAVMVLHRGTIQVEKYFQGDDRESLFNPHSMSKTVGALMLGIALEEGYIPSVDSAIAPWVPEWESDPRGKITLRDLLYMVSGLERLPPSNPAYILRKSTRQRFGTDFDGHTLDLQQSDPPGTKFEYNNDVNKLLGLVIERATGQRYAEYLSKNLWQPLELGDAAMYVDRPGGSVMKSCCIFSRPIDWLKVGELMRTEGRYEGRQIIPASWISDMVKPSPLYAGYGYQIWVGNRRIESERPIDAPKNYPWQSEPYAAEDLYFFSGHGYQRVWVVPSYELVIMRAGKDWPSAWDESYIPNIIIRDLQNQEVSATGI